MDIEARTREDTRDRIDRLHDTYGDFEVHTTETANDPEYFQQGVALARDGWRGDAGALVTDRQGRLLLIRHADAPDRWGHPGGGHESGETMEETALREVREETGVDCDLVDVNYVRRKTVYLDRDPVRRFHMLTVIFEAAYRSGTVEIGDEEILEARWHEQVPENALEFVRTRID